MRRKFPDRKVDMSFGATKHCSKCSTDKDRATSFSFDINRKDGLSAWCRPCSAEYFKIKQYGFVPTERYWKKRRLEYCQERINHWQKEYEKANK